jgi:predicted nucleic acid-binding protein
MLLSDIVDCSVFIDTNILIYAHTNTRFTPACEYILDKILERQIIGYLNSTVLDEFFHKMLLTQIYADTGLNAQQAIPWIKKNPEKVKNFILPFSITEEIIENYPFHIVDTTPALKQAIEYARQYGLLFSDAMHAACCTYYSLDHIMTNDNEFIRISDLSVIKPELIH